MSKINHYLASANTNENFVSKFNFINSEPDGFMFILKGGPGTGKSTLMKKIGEHFENQNEDVEYFHCSSDLDSLDGVRLSKHNICVVDGTSPHTMDAIIPGVTEKIIDLGTCINPEINQHKSEIIELLEQKKLCFEKAYLYLNSIGFHKNTLKLYENQFFNEKSSLKTVNQIIKFMQLSKQNKTATTRELFISAFSYLGETELVCKNQFNNLHFSCANSSDADFIFEKLNNKINNLGYSTTKFLNLINSNTTKYLLVNEFNVLIQPDIKNANLNKETYFLQELISNLEKQAGKEIENAKTFHKKVENFYISNMNFKGLDNITQNLISEIENKIHKG